MKFGCCLGLNTFMPQKKLSPALVDGSPFVHLVQMLEVLEQNGFDYVEAEVSLVASLEYEGVYTAFQKAFHASPLKPEVFSAFIPPRLAVVGPDVNQAAIKKYLQLSTSRIAESGGKIIIWGSGASRSYPAGFPRARAYAQIEEFLQKAAEYCRMNGILIAIEPMNANESNTINSLQEALHVAERADRQEIKVMLDLFHLMEEHEPLSVIQEARETLVHVHISDGQRLCPGKSDYPIFRVLQALKSIHYNQRISLECVFEDFAGETKDALIFLKKIWKSDGGKQP